MTVSRRGVVFGFMLAALSPLMAQAQQEASDAAAWQALRAGAVVLFRHAAAPGVGDPKGFRLGDCTTQRNLSDRGRAQAAALGERMRRQGVPVARVLASQWCRTLDTAELAFPGLAAPEPAFNSFFGDASSEPEQTARARAIIAAWRGPGTLVVVTHQVNITALTGLVPAEGVGVVLRPGAGGPEVVGRIGG